MKSNSRLNQGTGLAKSKDKLSYSSGDSKVQQSKGLIKDLNEHKKYEMVYTVRYTKIELRVLKSCWQDELGFLELIENCTTFEEEDKCSSCNDRINLRIKDLKEGIDILEAKE